MLAAIALLLTLLAAWYGQTYWQIVVDGAATPALSVKAEREPRLGKSVIGDPHRYFAIYGYVDGSGHEHASRQSISRDLYDELAQGRGARLTVHYSRSRPDVNVLDLDAVRWLSIILAGLAAVTWIAALLRLLRG